MDQFFFHPKVVHVPMALAVLIPLVTSGILFAGWRGWLPSRTWVVVFLLQAVLLGSGVLALQTGETEEERVEQVLAERHIESHEEAAEAFVWVSGGLLVLMAFPLVLSDGRVRQAILVGAWVGTIVVYGLGYRVGEAGGRLVYEHGAAQAYVGGSGSIDVAQPSRHEDDDDDDD